IPHQVDWRAFLLIRPIFFQWAGCDTHDNLHFLNRESLFLSLDDKPIDCCWLNWVFFLGIEWANQCLRLSLLPINLSFFLFLLPTQLSRWNRFSFVVHFQLISRR